MITDTEIKTKGIKILTQHLGDVEAERFIAFIQREPFDYTKWRQELDEDLSIEEISRKAMSLRKKPPDKTFLVPQQVMGDKRSPITLEYVPWPAHNIRLQTDAWLLRVHHL